MNPSKFGFTDEEFILAINTLRKLDAPLGEKITPVVSMDEKLNVEHFDSLGIVVFFLCGYPNYSAFQNPKYKIL